MKHLFFALFSLMVSTTLLAYDAEINGIYYNFSGEEAEVTFQKRGEDQFPMSDYFFGSVVIPEYVVYNKKTYNVTSISVAAFQGCSGLTSITIPESVTCLEERVFEGCVNLVSVNLPESMASIGGYAFSHCSSLSSINIPKSVTKIGSNAFCNCSSLTSFIIPEGCRGIDKAVFADCSNLATVVIPESVIYIEWFGFSGCSNLSSIVCNAKQPPYVGEFGFSGVDKQNCKLYVPKGCVEAYRAADLWKDFGNIVAFDNDGVFLSQETAWIDGFGYEQDGRYKIDDVKLFYNTTAGDTLINDKTYFRIRRTKICKTHCELDVDEGRHEFYRDMRIDTHDSNLQFFMREDDAGDVWFYTEDKDVFEEISHNTLYKNLAEDLVCRDLFLFNVRKKYDVGDSMSLGVIAFDSPNGFKEEGDYWDICPYEIKEIDEIVLLDGKTYPIYNNCFLESIGPLDGPLSGIGSPNSYSLGFNQLFAFYKDGQLIYRNDGYLSALEEYFPNILGVITGSEPTNPVIYTEGQMATIILPTTPDASKGKYYRLDRREDDKIIFEEGLNPKAHVPYIIVPNQDFTIDLSTLNLAGLSQDTVSIQGIRFIGSYRSEELEPKEGWYVDIIDTTPDCSLSPSEETEKGAFLIGALRAYLSWEDPYSQGPTKGEPVKLEIVLHDNPNGIAEMNNDKVKSEKYDDAIYDLQGRKINSQFSTFNSQFRKGLYIVNGKKYMVK